MHIISFLFRRIKAQVFWFDDARFPAVCAAGPAGGVDEGGLHSEPGHDKAGNSPATGEPVAGALMLCGAQSPVTFLVHAYVHFI